LIQLIFIYYFHEIVSGKYGFVVHDSTAFVLGGVAGHAGLFSTIMDVCRFAQLMLAGGMDQATNCRLFKETTVRLFTTPGLRTLANPRPFALG
jgi:CubicO group peptidase (beta-lactamase class C family)